MPCNGNLIDRIDQANVDRDQYATEARKAGRAACDMRTILRRHDLENELCHETLQWIVEHDRTDAERIAQEEAQGKREEALSEREKAKQAALGKLTMDERRLLGL